MNGIASFSKRYAAVILLLIVISLIGVISGGDPTAMQVIVDRAFGHVVEILVKVFWEIPYIKMPLIVFVLIAGAIFFTFRFNFINVRGFIHALHVVKGDFDDPDDPGEVSHFQALASALSATVGLGNIAGVAVAVTLGGPGAIIWMVIAAVFGMTSKFAESTLGQMYRIVDEDGEVQGGPMVYLRDGLAELKMGGLGKVLSVLFAVLCIGGSFGGGNMFQANQSFQAISQTIPALGGEKATANIKIAANQPFEIPTNRFLIRFTADATSEDSRSTQYRPMQDLSITKNNWKSEKGKFTILIEAEATKSGDAYNHGANTPLTMELGSVQALAGQGRKISWVRQGMWTDKELSLEENSRPAVSAIGMQVMSTEKFRGGTGDFAWLYGILLAVLVGVVIIGGIKRIAKVADKIVPAMAILYVFSAMAILILNYEAVPGAIAIMFKSAFNLDAGFGGLMGVIVQGVRRAAFSNEAGTGSAAIAHAAAKTKYAVREGLVASIGPFIDTIVICFMTGIVIVVTGVYADPATAGLEGVLLTGAAFEKSLSSASGVLLSIAVMLFAFSTMISWSYYGERSWTFLFGKEQTLAYRILFVIFVWIGCVSSLSNVIDFSDIMILSMAFPNILGVVLLSGKVKTALNEYWTSYKNGEFVKYKK